MQYNMLKGKIHRAVVKQADLNYVGSITVDTDLLEAAGILEYELVQIVDVENGNRVGRREMRAKPTSGATRHLLPEEGGRSGMNSPSTPFPWKGDARRAGVGRR